LLAGRGYVVGAHEFILLWPSVFVQGKGRFSFIWRADRTIVLYAWRPDGPLLGSCQKGFITAFVCGSHGSILPHYMQLTFPCRYGIKPFLGKGVNMYIDPNTGGMLFQALAGLLAVISGALFVFSRQIRQGIARLRRRNRKDKEDDQQ